MAQDDGSASNREHVHIHGRDHELDRDRKITYRIGWTSGTIKLSQPEPKPSTRRSPGRIAVDLLQREAPLPPLRTWKYITAAAAAAAFAGLCWLIYTLLSFE